MEKAIGVAEGITLRAMDEIKKRDKTITTLQQGTIHPQSGASGLHGQGQGRGQPDAHGVQLECSICSPSPSP